MPFRLSGGGMRRFLRSLATACAALLLVTCSDNPVAPRGGRTAALRLAPRFDANARFAPLTLDRVRIRVADAATEAILLDVTRGFTGNQVTLSEQVPLSAASVDVVVTLDLLAGQTLLFSGSSSLTLHQGRATAPTTVPVSYAGPGSNATTLVLAPRDTVVRPGAVFPLRASASDAQQQPVADFYLSWSLPGAPPAGAAIGPDGSFTAPATRGTVVVRAAMPNGVADTTRVIVLPAPSALAAVGGDQQTGVAGTRLAQPLAVQVSGSDQLPVPGVTVSFTVASGGGSVDSATATSDAQGIARTGATLGGAAGPQSFSASAAGLAPVTFTATATAPVVAAVPLALGGDHSCQIRGAATLCWGSNASGELGDGTQRNRRVPVPVSGGPAFVALAAGLQHTCGLTAAGQAFCWGSNTSGQLGDGSTARRATPTAVTGGLSFLRIAAGADFTCGLTPAGQAFCWGGNAFGQLGDGTTTQRLVPTAVSGGFSFTRISTEGDTELGEHTCAIATTGEAFCWGANGNGELGDGTQAGRLVPTAVTGGLRFSEISVGVRSSCAISSTGAGFCWGFNFGVQLLTPTAVAGGFSYTALDMGANHVCGQTAGGWRCGGQNSSGQLGDGTTTDQAAPVLPAGGFSFSVVAGGTSHTCGITSSGTRCWGANASGQLGVGSVADQLTPALVLGPAASVAASAGTGQTAVAGSPVPVPPAVVVRDAANAPLPGAEVVFAVTAGGGSITGDTVLTDAAGVAAVGSWTLGATAGSNGLSATVASAGVSGNPVGFNATGTAASNTLTWTGAADANFANAANWNPAVAPTAASDIVIGTAATTPVLGSNLTVHTLTVNPGGSLNLNFNTLNVGGTIVADGAVTGSGTIQMTGDGQVRGTVPFLVILGQATAGGSISVNAGNLNISGGNLTLAGHTATASGSVNTVNGGVLTMTNALDTVIAANASFGGGDEAGLLTAGAMLLSGNLASVGATPATRGPLVASGSHTIILTGGGAHQLQTLAGATAIAVQNLTVSAASGGVGLTTLTATPATLTVAGTLTSRPTGATPVLHGLAGGLVTAQGVNVTRLAVDTLPFAIGAGTVTRFDSVSFTNQSAAATQLAVNNPGAATAYTFDRLSFQTTPSAGAFYLSATDINGGTDGLSLVINLTSPTPATGGGFVLASGGATVNWPAAAPGPVTWTGAVSTDWNTAGNWNPARLPAAADSVVIPNTVTTWPTLTGRVTVAAMFEDGRLTLNGGVLQVTRSIAANTGINRIISFTTATDSLLVGGNVGAPISALTGVVAIGGDITVPGNFTGAVLILNGSGAQAVAGSGGGNVPFGYLIVNKPAGTVTLGPGSLFNGDSIRVTSGTLAASAPISLTNGLTSAAGTGVSLTSLSVGTTLSIGGSYSVGTTTFSLPSGPTVTSIPVLPYQNLAVNGGGATNGSAVLTGRTVVTGNFSMGTSGTVGATLALGGHTLAVSGTLTTAGLGPVQVSMTNPLDSLLVNGAATFSAPLPANPGNMTAGTLVVGGNLVVSQPFGGINFQAGGTHTTVLTGNSPTVTMAASGATGNTNRLQNLTWGGTGTLTLGDTALVVNGTFTIPAVSAVTVASGQANGSRLQFPVIAASGPIAFSNVRVFAVQTGGGSAIGLRNASFTGLPASATQLTIQHPGVSGGLTLDNLSFSPVPTTGFYVSATDNAATDGVPLVVNLTNPSPATPGALVQTAGGAVVNWPAGAVRAWTGGVSSDWSVAGNWSPAQVPGALDSAVIGAAANQPSLSAATIVGAVSIVAGGKLTINGQTLAIARGLSTGGTGVLVMQNQADGVSVGGNATFGGGSTVGLLTAGGISVLGNLTQTAGNSPDSYHPSGTHLTLLSGTAPTVSFATPATAFADFAWIGGGTLTLATPVTAQGTFVISSPGASTVTSASGARLTAASVAATAAVTFNNVPLTIDNTDGTGLLLSNITFQNMATDVSQLVVSHPGQGQTFTFTGLVFSTTPVAPNGFYLDVTDNTGAGDGGLTIDMASPTPSVASGFVRTAGGAVVNWPFIPVKAWTGAANTDWSNAGNWNPAGVPAPTDDVSIGTAAQQPTLTTDVAAHNVTVAGAGAQLTIGGHVLTLSGTLTVHTDGLLAMTSPADRVIVAGDAWFQGGNETGLLSAGELRVAGNFNQQQQTDARSFVASGTHRTVMTGTALQTVTFCCTAGASGFQELDLSGTVGINIQFSGNGVFVFDTLVSQVGAGTAPLLYMLGSPLTARRLRVDKLTVDRGTLILNEGGVAASEQLDNVTFQNYLTTQTQLQIVAPGGAASARTLTFNNLHFQPLTAGNTGRYLNVSAPTGTLVLDIPGATPAANGPSFTTTAGAATVLWPAAGIVWTGAATGDWGNAANWNPQVVPGTTSDVTIPAGLTLYPTLFAPGTARSVTVDGGSLTLNGQPLTVSQNFSTTGTGVLVSAATASILTVKGNVSFGGGSETGQLTLGTLNVAGNFTQQGSATSFVAAGSYKTVFNGTAPQAISIASGGAAASRFQDVDITNTGGAVTLGTPGQLMLVNGTLSLPVAATLTGGGSVQGAGVVSTAAGSTLSVFQLTAPSGGLSILGSYGVNQTILLNGGSVPNITYTNLTLSGAAPFSLTGNVTTAAGLTLQSNLTVAGRTVTTGAGLVVGGSGRLIMTNPADRVNVGGSALFQGGDETGSLTAGILTVAQNFTQAAGTGSPNTFVASGTHKTVLSALATSTVSFLNAGAATSHFQDLDITGTAPVDLGAGNSVVALGAIRVTGAANVTGGLVLARSLATVAGSNFAPTTLELTSDTLLPSGTFAPAFTQFDGGTTVPALTYQGLGINVPGSMALAGNTTTNDFTVLAGNLAVGGRTLTVNGGLTTQGSGTLTMTSAADLVTVTGATFFGGGDETGKLTAGVLRTGNSFVQDASNSAASFVASGNHTVEIVSQSPGGGVISLASPTVSQFQNLRVLFLSTLTSDAVVNGNLEVNFNAAANFFAKRVKVGGSFLKDGIGFFGPTRLTLLGSASVPGGTVGPDTLEFAGSAPQTFPLNTFPTTLLVASDVTGPGGSLGIGGDLLVTGTGSFRLAGTDMTVGGSVRLQDSGTLRMTGPSDQLKIALDLVAAGGDESGLLTNGILRVARNFSQAGAPTAFVATGNHLTIFNGGAGQSISFANPGTSGFGRLQLANVSAPIQLNGVVPVAADLLTTSVAITTLGGELDVASLSVNGLTLDGTNVVVNEQGIARGQQFDNVTFQNLPTVGALPLSVTAVGSSGTPRGLNFKNVNFPALPIGAGNLYVKLTSSNTQRLVLTLQGSNQLATGPGLSDPANAATVNGGTVLWSSGLNLTGLWAGSYTFGSMSAILSESGGNVAGQITDAANCVWSVTGTSNGSSFNLPSWTLLSGGCNATVVASGTLSADGLTASGNGNTSGAAWTFNWSRQ